MAEPMAVLGQPPWPGAKADPYLTTQLAAVAGPQQQQQGQGLGLLQGQEEAVPALGSHPTLQAGDWHGTDRERERAEREARRRVLREARKPVADLPVEHMLEIPGRWVLRWWRRQWQWRRLVGRGGWAGRMAGW